MDTKNLDGPLVVNFDDNNLEPKKITKRKNQGKSKKEKTEPKTKPKAKKPKNDPSSSIPINNEPEAKKLKFLAAVDNQKPDQQDNLKKELKKINQLKENEMRNLLDYELTRREFTVAHRLSQIILSITGSITDKLFKANGQIARRIENDTALEEAMCLEFTSVAHLLNNEAKIGAYIASDCLNGKKAEIEARPIITIIKDDLTPPPPPPIVPTPPTTDPPVILTNIASDVVCDLLANDKEKIPEDSSTTQTFNFTDYTNISTIKKEE